ncbi:MAG: hypothetical protein M5R36_01085 [Deltaproteobacteria bacterium]|nr:hypothetical protein [Deltaproteobacteria bacterium]
MTGDAALRFDAPNAHFFREPAINHEAPQILRRHPYLTVTAVFWASRLLLVFFNNGFPTADAYTGEELLYSTLAAERLRGNPFVGQMLYQDYTSGGFWLQTFLNAPLLTMLGCARWVTKLVPLGFAFATLMLFVTTARRFAGELAGWIVAGLLLLGTPATLSYGMVGFANHAELSAFYAAALFAAAFLLLERPVSLRVLTVSGAAFGLIIGLAIFYCYAALSLFPFAVALAAAAAAIRFRSMGAKAFAAPAAIAVGFLIGISSIGLLRGSIMHRYFGIYGGGAVWWRAMTEAIIVRRAGGQPVAASQVVLDQLPGDDGIRSAVRIVFSWHHRPCRRCRRRRVFPVEGGAQGGAEPNARSRGDHRHGGIVPACSVHHRRRAGAGRVYRYGRRLSRSAIQPSHGSGLEHLAFYRRGRAGHGHRVGKVFARCRFCRVRGSPGARGPVRHSNRRSFSKRGARVLPFKLAHDVAPRGRRQASRVGRRSSVPRCRGARAFLDPSDRKGVCWMIREHSSCPCPLEFSNNIN